ncbi:uncharacterized protein B0J16DRAFT_375528 [Fusarium flagelliforme]|uniref:Uncharacterized protein n=1 Tax=Fusarium flagelliforme TaxID=2675880 RepID=A0A395M831_9HYPO|nr:uncharacterized protein B0J16DRAFT_375528 [Fusarium flagelliforme]KAH7174735.1 hypothetical protein B0J16DRAFT_375528 [Fusarium flagelliforme]RFN44031.1 hypothetical protein FIE12Z_11736 [Fusarium flagelliforme]
MDSFKTCSDAELIELINKHGADNALEIMDLARLANKPDEVGGSSDDVVSSGAEMITSTLSKYGLTRVEYEVLKFWASQLGAGKLEFLTTHTHTIFDARPDCCSEHDMRFAGDTISCIKSCVARDDKKLADWSSEGYARILEAAHFMLMVEATVRMESMCEDYQDSASFDRLYCEYFREMPHTGETPNAHMRISEVEHDKNFLNEWIQVCDEYIQAGNQLQVAIDTSRFLVECIHKCDEQIQILKEQ